MAFAAWAWTTAPSGARSNRKPRKACRRNGDERSGHPGAGPAQVLRPQRLTLRGYPVPLLATATASTLATLLLLAVVAAVGRVARAHDPSHPRRRRSPSIRDGMVRRSSPPL